VTAYRIAGGGVVRVDDPAPAPGVDDVVIEVDGAWLAPEAAAAPAVVAGSAAVGTIVDAGAQARALVGTRAVLGPHVPCGDCEVCRRGGAAVCPRGGMLGIDRRGTLAERITVPARWVVGFGGGLDIPGPIAAAVGGDLAIAYALYARASIGPREPAVVIGDDAAARLLVQILVARGVTPIVVAGAERGDAIADAVARGAAVAPIAAGDDAPAIRRRVAAVAESLAQTPDDRAEGAVGKPVRLFATTAAARPIALALAGPRAAIVVRAPLAGADSGLALAGEHLALEVTAHAVRGAHPDLLVEAAALVVKGEVRLDGAVRVVPVGELGAALGAEADGRSVVVAMTP
jgi:threonine dehydrogenase-like Zn-dependent dehydrogenase